MKLEEIITCHSALYPSPLPLTRDPLPIAPAIILPWKRWPLQRKIHSLRRNENGLFEECWFYKFFLCYRNHAWVSFVGFAESYTEVFKNTDGLPAELQQAATKQNGIKCYVTNMRRMLLLMIFPEFWFLWSWRHKKKTTKKHVKLNNQELEKKFLRKLTTQIIEYLYRPVF